MNMTQELETDLFDAIAVALVGSGIKPGWIFKHIKPVLDQYESESKQDYNICPECHIAMNADEDSVVFSCEHCKQAYQGGKRL